MGFDHMTNPDERMPPVPKHNAGLTSDDPEQDVPQAPGSVVEDEADEGADE